AAARSRQSSQRAGPGDHRAPARRRWRSRRALAGRRRPLDQLGLELLDEPGELGLGVAAAPVPAACSLDDAIAKILDLLGHEMFLMWYIARGRVTRWFGVQWSAGQMAASQAKS